MVNNNKEDLVVPAIEQISLLITNFINESTKDMNFHEKAIECLKELRTTCIK